MKIMKLWKIMIVTFIPFEIVILVSPISNHKIMVDYYVENFCNIIWLIMVRKEQESKWCFEERLWDYLPREKVYLKSWMIIIFLLTSNMSSTSENFSWDFLFEFQLKVWNTPVLVFQLEVYLLNKKEQLLDGIQIKHL